MNEEMLVASAIHTRTQEGWCLFENVTNIA